MSANDITNVDKPKDSSLLPAQLSALEDELKSLKENNKILEQQISKFRSYIENVNDLIGTITLRGEITYVSPNVTDITGHSVDEVLQQNMFEKFMHPDDVTRTKAFFHKGVDTRKKIAGIEYRIRHKDGSWHWYTTNASPIFNARNRVVSFLAIQRDITEKKAVSDALIKSQMGMKEAQRIGKLGNWEWVPENNKIHWSEEMYNIFGIKARTDVTTNRPLKFFHPEDRKIILACTKKAIKTRQPQSLETRIIIPGNEIRYIYAKGEVQLDKNGKLEKVIGICQDITERRVAEDKLKESTRKLNTMIDNLKGVVYRCVNDGYWTMEYISAGITELSGYATEDFIENKSLLYSDIIHPDDVKSTWFEIVSAIAEHRSFTFEYRIKHKDGTIHWVWERGCPVYENNRLIAFEGFISDITARKDAESAFKVSQEQYQLLVDTMREGVVYVNNDDKIIYINQSCCDIYGYNQKDLIGKTGYQYLIHEADRHIIEEKNRLRLDGVIDVYEIRGRKVTGEIIWLKISGAPIKNHSGKVIGSVGLMSDITEQKLATDALIESQLRLKEAQRIGKFGNWEWVPGIDNVIWSDEMYNIFGLEPGIAFHTEDTIKLFHPDDRKSVEESTKIAIVTGNPQIVEARIIKPSGEIRHLFGTGEVTLNKKGELVKMVGIYQDVTERKVAQEELLVKDCALGSSLSAICLAGLDGTIFYANEAYKELWGFKSINQVIGSNVKDHQLLKNQIEELILTPYIHNNGYVGEGITVKPDGTRCHVHISANMVRHSNGKPICMMGSFNDITEQKQLEEQLYASQKMEAIGQLAGGVAHDFNNLLTVILGYGEELVNNLAIDNYLRKDAEEIVKAGKRASDLTHQLLTFSHKQVIQPRVLNLNDVVSNLHKMLLRLIGEHINITIVQKDQDCMVKADAGQLEQVIINLVVNSRDAMPKGGKLNIETSRVIDNKEYAAFTENVKPGKYIKLTISDTGCGMEKEIINRVFEPFFTTKKIGKGLGLGLSTVYGIVKQSEGYISVQSILNVGTTIQILLPFTKEKPDQMTESIEVHNYQGTGEHILIVEDEESLCEYIKKLVENLGYKVTTAIQSNDALSAIKHGLKPDLIITDVIMPEMNGKELIDKIKKIIPNQIVLYMSGFNDEVIVHHGILNKDIPFIQKPFTPEILAYNIKKLLKHTKNIKSSIPSILLLDDDEDVRILMQRACRKKGFDFIGTENLAESIKVLSENKFDALVIDLNLINMNGLDALREIRNIGNSTPAFLYSGAFPEIDNKVLKSLGVVKKIVKSSDNMLLLNEIEAML